MLCNPAVRNAKPACDPDINSAARRRQATECAGVRRLQAYARHDTVIGSHEVLDHLSLIGKGGSELADHAHEGIGVATVVGMIAVSRGQEMVGSVGIVGVPDGFDEIQDDVRWNGLFTHIGLL